MGPLPRQAATGQRWHGVAAPAGKRHQCGTVPPLSSDETSKIPPWVTKRVGGRARLNFWVKTGPHVKGLERDKKLMKYGEWMNTVLT